MKNSPRRYLSRINCLAPRTDRSGRPRTISKFAADRYAKSNRAFSAADLPLTFPTIFQRSSELAELTRFRRGGIDRGPGAAGGFTMLVSLLDKTIASKSDRETSPTIRLILISPDMRIPSGFLRFRLVAAQPRRGRDVPGGACEIVLPPCEESEFVRVSLPPRKNVV